MSDSGDESENSSENENSKNDSDSDGNENNTDELMKSDSEAVEEHNKDKGEILPAVDIFSKKIN